MEQMKQYSAEEQSSKCTVTTISFELLTLCKLLYSLVPAESRINKGAAKRIVRNALWDSAS